MKRRSTRMTPREAGKAALLVVVACWMAYMVVNIFHKEEIARTTVAETKAESGALEARRASLAATVEGLETGRGKDASLRELYGVAKPGEDVIIVVPKKDLPPPPEPTFWNRVKDLLGL